MIIQLTHKQMAQIDEVDSDLAEFKWYTASQFMNHKPYVVRRGHSIALHRVIMGRIIGRDLTRQDIVDHIDGDVFNNTRANLRLATSAQNTRNSGLRKDSTSGYKGVTRHKCGKWQASIKMGGKSYYLGLFNDPKQAHEVYKAKSLEMFGEYARFE